MTLDLKMRVALAQVNPIVGDIEANRQMLLQQVSQAKEAKAELIVFSEMALIGYPAQDLLLRPEIVELAEQQLEHFAKASENIAIIVGTIRRSGRTSNRSSGKPLFNTAAFFAKGELKGFQDKQLLPDYDLFFERRYFEPGETSQLWQLNGYRFAITICEDIWQQRADLDKDVCYINNPVDELERLKPDFVINIAASPYARGRIEIREQVAKSCQKRCGVPLVMVNQVGANDSILFDGHSFVLNKEGVLIAQAKGFKTDLLLIDLFAKQNTRLERKKEGAESLFLALKMGVEDYFRKLGFKKACIGLSGGIDSSVVGAIAVEALGKENVVALTMPSRYSSEATQKDAHRLAANLGIGIHEVPIEGPHKAFLELLTPYFGDRQSDFTEENMQARLRMLILMAFCNKMGYLLLNTSNKSELAMGYSTLYGDMGGSLAVIGDVTKEGVYELGSFINRDKELIPTSIINRPPTAELKENQRDTDTLPPYALVDAVVKGYIEENETVAQIAARLEVPQEQIEQLVARLQANEYKRHQAPPSLRVSPKCFTAGRYFPIVARALVE